MLKSLALSEVAPRDEFSMLKQQMEQAVALSNSPDAVPHNTVREDSYSLK